jgi:ferredoxin
VLGAKPCDAAALEVLDKVMDWDYHDELWFGRRAATTIIAIGCGEKKHGCFCDEVGIGPSSTRGSDLFFTPRADGSFRVQVVSPKGEALLRAYPDRFTDAPDEPSEPPKGGATDEHLVLSLPKIREWLEENFENKLWEVSGLRCNGCGSCAAVCPTCHCFDIVDEPEGVAHGTRRRNWDTCQSCRFTVHASGHNPRADQNARIRQRVMHKFFIYPERFGEVLCTGCGRCSRNCPSGVDLDEILHEIDALMLENAESHS